MLSEAKGVKHIKNKITKSLDLPGFEPGAFRMQSERDTTTLQTLDKGYAPRALLEEEDSAIRRW